MKVSSSMEKFPIAKDAKDAKKSNNKAVSLIWSKYCVYVHPIIATSRQFYYLILYFYLSF